ncbi:hypothetical protein AB0F43_28625 [Kribbella sp. NPDC023972]|uniref:hypothetical protein n=1 Tax=Kribbella sp. NPDC023972 TaxID=3154795 RepID=UPI0034030613
MGHRVRVWVISVVVLGVLAGCGQDTLPEGGSPPGSGSNGGGKGDGGGKDDGGGWLSWVPFGPKDPTFPTPTWPAYNYLAKGKCSDLRSYLRDDPGDGGKSEFGQAMVALCRAAVDGKAKDWAILEAKANADPGALGHDCLTPLVKGLMNRALAWHEAHPGQKPKVKFQRLKGETKCGAKDNENREPTEEPTGEPTTTDEASPTDEPTEESSPAETAEQTG